MPKPKIYPETILLRLTRETRRAINVYMKATKLKQGEAIRDRLEAGLNADSDILEAYYQGCAEGAERSKQSGN